MSLLELFKKKVVTELPVDKPMSYDIVEEEKKPKKKEVEKREEKKVNLFGVKYSEYKFVTNTVSLCPDNSRMRYFCICSRQTSSD